MLILVIHRALRNCHCRTTKQQGKANGKEASGSIFVSFEDVSDDLFGYSPGIRSSALGYLKLSLGSAGVVSPR